MNKKNDVILNEEELVFLEVVKEWIKNKKYVKDSDIEYEFSVPHSLAAKIIKYLINNKYIDIYETYDKGHKVMIFNPGCKIYLLDYNLEMVNAWKKEFAEYQEIIIIHDDFKHFMDEYDIECVVSPANSFGIMDGGYDLAITNYFGDSLQKEVQKYIRHYFYGEQPLGTSFIIDIPHSEKKLIHTPTMQIPKPIKDDFIIYQCMRVTLMEALNNNIKSIVIPAFGGNCGKISFDIIAKNMKNAYLQVISRL